MKKSYKLLLILEVYKNNQTLKDNIEEKLKLKLSSTNSFDRAIRFDKDKRSIETIAFETIMEWESIEKLVFYWLIKMEELAVQWMIRKPVLIGDKWIFAGTACPEYRSKIFLNDTYSIVLQIHEE